MEEIKQLLKDYLDEKFSSEEFVVHFLALARELRDETLEILNKDPELKTQLEQLFTRRIKRTISEVYYQESWQKLVIQLEQIGQMRLKPYSVEEQVLSHLFVEADAHREDPNDRIKGLNIGDAELRIEVQKALEILANSKW